MTTTAWALLALAACLALGDWIAVGRGLKRLEYACKPAVMLALIGVALKLQPAVATQRSWFVLALALGLVGDICLVLPFDALLWGLGAFLLGHLAYIAGFVAASADHPPAPTTLALLGTAFLVSNLVVGRPVLGAVGRIRPRLFGPVLGYGVVWSALLAFALTSPAILARLGALSFWFSDVLIGFDRFVRPARPRVRVLIIVTYHLGQAALVLSLAGRP